MNFVFAETLGINMDLIALRPASQPFSIHLYQHQGSFIATAQKIGNGTNVSPQFRHFFDQARQQNSDLVLTPEYSCPWEVMMEIIANEDLWPNSGKLWAIGCESITRNCLAANKQASAKGDVLFYAEHDDPENNKTYYDPLVYLFKGIHDNTEKLIVLVQYKTRHMGAWFTAIERDHLIEGNTIWILRNQGESHRLMSIICSEAMNFPQELTQQKMLDIGWNDNAYYVYNPQANPEPTHQDFIDFRKFVLRTDRKELIALNWNSKTKYGANPFIRIGTTRSGFYTQSTEVDLSEARIRANHENGLYYFMFGIKYHAFILNSAMDIFLVTQVPIIITGAVAPQARRDGPLITGVECYDLAKTAFSNSLNTVQDAHLPFLATMSCGCTFLMQANGCILEKERLVCLSCGQLKKGLSLLDLKSLLTFSMRQDNEANLRITVADDTRPESQGRKSVFINSINVLLHDIIPDKKLYPESIIDLDHTQITIGFGPYSRNENYRYNVVTNTGNSCHATMVYMNGLPDNEIKTTFDALQELFDSENPNKRRVVIFYRRGKNTLSYSDPKAGSITHTEDKDGANILNTQL